MTRDPVLFFHCVDAHNLNAQANNTKNILAHWNDEGLPAVVFHFRTPDPAVARNPHVRFIKLPPNRLWKARALAAGVGRYAAVIYPGFAAVLDNRVRELRERLGLGGAVISTLEGLPADVRTAERVEERLTALAGHPVFCQRVDPKSMSALDVVKARSDLIVSISPFLCRMAEHLWPGPTKADIPLGVDLTRFHARGRVPHGENPRVRIVAAGSFQTHKRPDIFLELARAHPEADFIWFGEGARRETLAEQAHACGLRNLTFPGAVDADALAEAFRQADIFTLPSVSEGVPKVTQEAAACGLPMVCMGYYEPFSVVQGVNGFLAADDAAYADHITTLIGDPTMRARMGAASADMAREWSWESLATRWQEAIQKAIKNKQFGGGRR